MGAPTQDETINIEGPKGDSLFWRPLMYCFPPSEQGKLQVELNDFFEHFKATQDDRSLVLVGALVVEHSLDGLLRAYVPGYQTLAQNRDFTFSMKIDLGQSLRLVPSRVVDDADFLRKLRNEFAHNLSTKSLDELPGSMLRSLDSRVTSYNPSRRETNRRRFTDLAAFVSMAFGMYERHVEKLDSLIRGPEFLDSCFRKAAEEGSSSASSRRYSSHGNARVT